MTKTLHKGQSEPALLDGDTAAEAALNERIAGEVDGMPAIIDGTVPRELAPMVEVSNDTLLIELAKREQIVREISSRRGMVSNELKQAKELRDNVVSQLADRGLKLTDPTAELPFGDDAGDDGDDE